MNPALYLLTGPWASGKTTLVSPLRRLLPEVVVFDWDTLLPGLSLAVGTDASQAPRTWPSLRAMWTAVLESALEGGRSVVLCGPATPADFDHTALADYTIYCAYLNCPNALLSRRLRARKIADADMAEELAEMERLRRSAYAAIPVDQRTPPQVAESVAAWIRGCILDVDDN